ncbi:membrane-spanning 4-domains subfamily A member 4A-like isoform X1 [Pyxicephalus adspersus]|uniref:membrane-spanning 4-domains subfamily A member 4A-like isoform X1 n=1 Tax=Pyxicephalus adspersus TaxID=30357 RepID=UPI003B58EC05
MYSTQFSNKPQYNFSQTNHAAPAQQWNSPMFHQAFLKGKPTLLGSLLIFVGILHIGMGVSIIFTTTYSIVLTGIPFWGAILDIIAGSLSVAAASKPSMCLIKGSLGLSIAISIFSFAGVALNTFDLLIYYDCYDSGCYDLVIAGHVLRGVFILTYLLQFSVSVSISVFGCRARKYKNLEVPNQGFMMQNSAAVQQPPTAAGFCPVHNRPIYLT